MSPFLPLSFGLLASASAYLTHRNLRLLYLTSLGLCLLSVTAACAIALPLLLGEPALPNLLWLLDPLSGVLLFLVALLYLFATIVSVHYIASEHHEGTVNRRQIPLYFTCLHLFAVAMMATVLLNNVLLMWIALEATTLSTVLLVAFYVKEGAIEAAWKYLIICSTGIALGLIGILFALHAAASASNGVQALFSFSALREQASSFDTTIMRLSFIFLFIGFGTKVGFAPMHTWLPDAHSKTPAPVSAMLSGILLTVALGVLLRFKLLTDLSLGSYAWSNGFFLVFGLSSIILASFILPLQDNYKRMLAYHSIEHMGIIGFAIGLGPLGATAAVIHLIGHALAKSLLFFGAGEIILKYKSTKIHNVHALLRRAPVLAILFLFGFLALLAVPPSPLFTSEFLLVRSGLVSHPFLILIFLACLTMIFVAVLHHTLAMFAEDHGTTAIVRGETHEPRWNVTHAVMLVEVLLLCAFGIFVLTEGGLTFASSIARSFVLPTP